MFVHLVVFLIIYGIAIIRTILYAVKKLRDKLKKNEYNLFS